MSGGHAGELIHVLRGLPLVATWGGRHPVRASRAGKRLPVGAPAVTRTVGEPWTPGVNPNVLQLAVTSTNGRVRRLDHRRWKLLHRLTYVAAGLGLLRFAWRLREGAGPQAPASPCARPAG